MFSFLIFLFSSLLLQISCWNLWVLLIPSKNFFPFVSTDDRNMSVSTDSSYFLIPKRNLSQGMQSVQFSHSVMSNCLRPHESQHARPPCPSPTPRVHSNSHPSSWWCCPAISSSVIPFSCPQSLPASGSFPVSQLFAWGGQSITISASASVLPMNIRDWSPLGWTGWISLQSKGLWRVCSNTTVQRHQFFSAQLYSPTLTSIHDHWRPIHNSIF